jgi:hypothetical protein
MNEPLTITCPDCKTILIVDRKTGKILEVRKPLVDDPSGDRFEDARQRVLQQGDRAQKAFEEARQREKEKHARLEALFKEKAQEYKDQPIERPEHPMDRD